MPKKTFTTEQIMNRLRKAEAVIRARRHLCEGPHREQDIEVSPHDDRAGGPRADAFDEDTSSQEKP